MYTRRSWPVVLGFQGQYDPHPPLYYALVKLVTGFLPEVLAAPDLSHGEFSAFNKVAVR